MTSRTPWTRLIAEGAVVVGSILVAFAIDASWDQRRDRVLQLELLASLQGALESNSQLAAARVEVVLQDRILLQRFIKMTPVDAGTIPADSTWVFLRSIFRSNTFDLNTAEVAAILDENPGLLREQPELRAALAQWRSRSDALDRQEQQLFETYQDVLDALAGHEELQPALAQLPGARVIPGLVAARVRQDNEVMRLAARKAFHSQIQLQFLEQVEADAAAAASLLRAILVR